MIIARANGMMMNAATTIFITALGGGGAAYTQAGEHMSTVVEMSKYDVQIAQEMRL